MKQVLFYIIYKQTYLQNNHNHMHVPWSNKMLQSSWLQYKNKDFGRNRKKPVSKTTVNLQRSTVTVIPRSSYLQGFFDIFCTEIIRNTNLYHCVIPTSVPNINYFSSVKHHDSLFQTFTRQHSTCYSNF